MKRNKGFKKIKLPPYIKDFRNVVIKNFILAAIAMALLFAATFILKSFFHNSDYFRLRAIETKGSFLDPAVVATANGEALKLYKGRNVFTINLKYVAKSMEAYYPDARDITVRIGLPDRLVVILKFRKPVALLSDGKYYPVDEDGSVLPSVAAKSFSGLPVINGISVKNSWRRAGASRNLQLAIELLRNIKGSKFLKGYNVNIVDAGDAKNMAFYLNNGIEVRIGCEDFEGRLAMLESTLKNPRLVVGAVKYIDLRYKDVIIGPES